MAGEERNVKYFILAERNQEATVRDRKIKIVPYAQLGSANTTEPNPICSILMISILGVP